MIFILFLVSLWFNVCVWLLQQSCDPRGDTVCQKCLQGVTWNTGLNYLPCQPCTDCSDLHRTVRAECVPSADTRCSHCHIGFHDVEGACIPCPEKSAHAECLRKTKQLPNMAKTSPSFNTTYEDEYGECRVGVYWGPR